MITFLSDNLVLNGAISMVTGTENVQFPLTNISHTFTTKVFRSTTNTCSILIDLYTTQSVDTVMVVGSSVSGLGFTSMSIQGSPTADFTGVTSYPIDMSGKDNIGFKSLPVASNRFWKVTVANTAGSYVELSNIYIGSKTEITNNGFSQDSFKYSVIDNCSIVDNKYGQKFIDTYNKIKKMGGTIKYCTKAEVEQIKDVGIQNGRSTPIWVLMDNDDKIAVDGKYMFSGYYYIDNDMVWTATGGCLFDVDVNLTEAT